MFHAHIAMRSVLCFVVNLVAGAPSLSQLPPIPHPAGNGFFFRTVPPAPAPLRGAWRLRMAGSSNW
jgi:hypothetical protein